MQSLIQKKIFIIVNSPLFIQQHLLAIINKLKKDKVDLNKDFYVLTGSTVGVVPILGKGLYSGKIDKLGSAKAIIH